MGIYRPLIIEKRPTNIIRPSTVTFNQRDTNGYCVDGPPYDHETFRIKHIFTPYTKDWRGRSPPSISNIKANFKHMATPKALKRSHHLHC